MESRAMLVKVFSLLGALVVLAGCSAVDERPAADINLQVESEMWSFQEAQTLDCMTGYGFEYVTRAAPASSGQQVAQTPYALTEEQARTQGFGYVQNVLSSAGESGTLDSNEKYRATLSDERQLAYDHALEGDPASSSPGCRATAQEDSYAKYSDQFRSILGNADSITAIVNDPRYLEFEASWAQCMSDASYATTGFEDFHLQWIVKAGEIVAPPTADESIAPPVDHDLARTALDAEIQAALTNLECLAPLENDFNELVDEALG